MKQLRAFVQKEFKHIIRDKRTLLIVFAMPVVLVLLFGFAITTEVKDTKIAILDNAKDELSIALVNKIASSGYFDVHKYLNSNSEIKSVFGDGEVRLALVIPDNFSKEYYSNGKAQVQLIADASDLNNATSIINYANAIIKDYQAELTNAPHNGGLFETTVKMLYNQEQKSVYMYVPGVLALVLALISAMMTAMSLTKEKELGTLRVLTVSPLRRKTIIAGKVIPYLIISLIDALIILLLAVWVLAMPINGSYILLFVVCLTFLLTSVSMGIFISSFTDTQQVAAFISIVGLFLPTTLLSGFIYPIENMPVVLQGVCQLFPAKWFIVAIKNVMIKGVGLEYVWVELLVMFSMTIFFISISMKRESRN